MDGKTSCHAVTLLNAQSTKNVTVSNGLHEIFLFHVGLDKIDRRNFCAGKSGLKLDWVCLGMHLWSDC